MSRKAYLIAFLCSAVIWLFVGVIAFSAYETYFEKSARIETSTGSASS